MAPPSFELPARPHPNYRLPLPLERPEMATRAMLRFACTRAACPDSCCRDFGVHFDQASMTRMLSSTAHDPVDHERVVRLVVLGMPLPNVGKTQVVLGPDGSCPLLESSGDCVLHRKHGESSLGTACSVFPRTSLALPDRVEVTGTLACPELARLTLLADDGVRQDASAVPLMPRSYVGKAVEAEDDISDAYAAPFLQVRSTLLDLFRHQGFPLSSRLASAAHLAAQVDDFFHRGTEAFTGSKRQFGRQRLAKELSAATSASSLAKLHAELQAFAAPADAVLSAVFSLLTERLRLPHPSRFSELVTSVLASLASPADLPAAAHSLEHQRTHLEIRWPGLTDRILSRYCQHYLLRYPYTDAASLLHYLGRLSLAVAAIRLLILGASMLRSPTDATEFSKIAVEVTQIFTKAVSHQADFLAAIHRASENGAGNTFGRLVLFAKSLD
jgi:lysine-N-methylase